MKTAIFAACAAWLSASAASALEVTFYPGDHIYAYEADPLRGASTLMIHDIGIRNDGATPVTLDNVTIELMAGERTLDTRALDAAELTRAASNGVALQQGGLLDVLAFQFGGTQLLPAGTQFSADLTLDPGEAIMINSQVFAYRGLRDSVRVRVNGGGGEGRLAIRTGVSQGVYQFPLRGQWYNGAGSTLHSHHRWSPMEEFGFDLLQLGPDFRTHRRDGARFSDYDAYGEPVYAAAEGRVVTAIGDQQEDLAAMIGPGETPEAYMARLREDQMTRLAGGLPGIIGNGVVIDHGNGEFSAYAHLKPGSVRVHAGETVRRGQQIGQVGSSGNSTEPHLHFQVCNGPDPLMCAGVPVRFEPGGGPSPDLPHAPQTGEFLSRPGEN